jgi:hypothetical protein
MRIERGHERLEAASLPGRWGSAGCRPHKGVQRVMSLTADVADVLSRLWIDLVARPAGPLSFRFILQPVMATLLGIRDGIKDARTGRSPYFWTVLHNPAERRARLREGLIATSRILALGLVMDAIYQFKVFGRFHPGEAVIVALALAFIPYLLVRGPAARITSWLQTRRPNASQARRQP